MNAEEIAAIAKVIELTEKNPPGGELWDSAGRYGPKLADQIRSWLKERL